MGTTTSRKVRLVVTKRARPAMRAQAGRALNLIGYLRVSTDRQVEHGQGLAVQRNAIKAWARENGHRIVRWCSDEGISGGEGLDVRRGLNDAVLAIHDGEADGIAVKHVDRLARELWVQEAVLSEIWKAGGVACCVEGESFLSSGDADDPTRTLMRHLLGAVAQFERSMARARMKAGKDLKRERGGYIGGRVPYGYKLAADGSRLVTARAEQATLTRMVELRDQGLSLRAIGAALQAEGRKPRTGREWQPTTVAGILRRYEADQAKTRPTA